MRALILLQLVAIVQKSLCDLFADYGFIVDDVTPPPVSNSTIAPQILCVLPPYPHHGTYTATRGLKPGDAVPQTALTCSCEWGYRLIGVAFPNCYMGEWYKKMPTCESQCKPLNSTSVEFKCYKQNSSLEISCDLPQDNNSRAKATCKDSYSSESPPRDLNCIDGSWDYMPICTPAPQTLCVLPPYPRHGTYTPSRGFKPGDAVPHTALTCSCEWGYRLIGEAFPICYMGEWFMKMPTCESQCKPLNSTSVEFKCYNENSSLEISCDLPQDNHSRAKVTCKDSYSSESPPRDLNCIDGSWDYMPICTPESDEDLDNAPSCGRIKPSIEVKTEKRITSDTRYAKDTEFPWMVALYRPKHHQQCTLSDSHCWFDSCSGSLIGLKVVLLSGYYVYKYKQDKLKVRAGNWNLYQEQFVSKIIIHPQYSESVTSGLRNDVALLVVESPFTSADNIGFICLPPPNLNVAPTGCKVANRKKMTVVGTGYKELLEVMDVNYLDHDECQRIITQEYSSILIYDSVMCASGVLNQGQGAAGNPLMCIADDHYYAYGLLSWIIYGSKLPKVYTDVVKVRSWIDKEMRANGFTTDTYTPV